jgi:hypothetical protein
LRAHAATKRIAANFEGPQGQVGVTRLRTRLGHSKRRCFDLFLDFLTSLTDELTDGRHALSTRRHLLAETHTNSAPPPVGRNLQIVAGSERRRQCEEGPSPTRRPSRRKAQSPGSAALGGAPRQLPRRGRLDYTGFRPNRRLAPRRAPAALPARVRRFVPDSCLLPFPSLLRAQDKAPVCQHPDTERWPAEKSSLRYQPNRKANNRSPSPKGRTEREARNGDETRRDGVRRHATGTREAVG